jgi:hypothetical protein
MTNPDPVPAPDLYRTIYKICRLSNPRKENRKKCEIFLFTVTVLPVYRCTQYGTHRPSWMYGTVALLIPGERSEHEGGWTKTDLLELNYSADLQLCGLADFSRESSRIFRPPQYCTWYRYLGRTEREKADDPARMWENLNCACAARRRGVSLSARSPSYAAFSATSTFDIPPTFATCAQKIRVPRTRHSLLQAPKQSRQLLPPVHQKTRHSLAPEPKQSRQLSPPVQQKTVEYDSMIVDMVRCNITQPKCKKYF